MCVCANQKQKRRSRSTNEQEEQEYDQRLLDGTIADPTIDKGIRIATPIGIGTFTAVLHDNPFPKGGPMVDPDMMWGIHGGQ